MSPESKTSISKYIRPSGASVECSLEKLNFVWSEQAAGPGGYSAAGSCCSSWNLCCHRPSSSLPARCSTHLHLWRKPPMSETTWNVFLSGQFKRLKNRGLSSIMAGLMLTEFQTTFPSEFWYPSNCSIIYLSWKLNINILEQIVPSNDPNSVQQNNWSFYKYNEPILCQLRSSQWPEALVGWHDCATTRYPAVTRGLGLMTRLCHDQISSSD